VGAVLGVAAEASAVLVEVSRVAVAPAEAGNKSLDPGTIRERKT